MTDRAILADELAYCLRELMRFSGRRQGNQETIRALWADIKDVIDESIKAGYIPKEIEVQGMGEKQRPLDFPHIALEILKWRR